MTTPMDDFIEQMGLMMQAEGQPRIAGQILGYLIVEGEQAAACRRMKFRERGCGRIEEVVICSYTRFRGGEIVEIVEYPDTLAIMRLLGD